MTAQQAQPNGLLLIDKPPAHTSHDVVARTRKRAGTRKVGHAGTLDPMATGLLILGVGPSTRLLTYVVGRDKEYVATIRLGQSSTTDDAEGELASPATEAETAEIDEPAVRRAMVPLTGDIAQIPSTVSAIKVDGKRAYARARAGEDVELAARPVTVAAFDLHAMRRSAPFVDLDVRVECSSGTYIRALARDLGTALGVGGHLTSLRRTRIGPFSVTDAVTLDELAVPDDLLTSADAAESLFPCVTLDGSRARALGYGQRIAPDGFPDTTEPIAALTEDGHLIGLVEVRKGVVRSLMNFPQGTQGTR
ncbi:tRNA pseudouridine(55) synthase TruB [Microbacterium sp. MPKO10]|uniref:tRNA pseudouridine(55) synthase TruB n=1 Tax=Microbacterium sp. MPKO10 TaxID=2989818 RepID=UPI002235F939|nr:tRNA pseudouridine(55) synthase TruB [Microbacterium sp. MPKO10]MCW4458325.1 tRNA pseudouridine(55) synthase TruB [Microbacterium sp. MPKO10]